MGSGSCQVASVPPGQAGRGRGPVQEASLCSSGPRSWQEVALLLEERQSPQSSDSRYRPTPHQGRLRRAGLLGGSHAVCGSLQKGSLSQDLGAGVRVMLEGEGAQRARHCGHHAQKLDRGLHHRI